MNLVELFFVECHAHDNVPPENNIGNLNPVPVATAVTNTGILLIVYCGC